MTYPSDHQPASELKQVKMRATLRCRFSLRDNLSAAMGVDAAPLQWLLMAMDPDAFTGTLLNNHATQIYRSIIFRHVAEAWIKDSSQLGLGITMAEALNRTPGQNHDFSALALQSFASAAEKLVLPDITDDVGKANTQALAIGVMHRMIGATPDEKAMGQRLRDKLDARLAAYAASAPLQMPLPLGLQAPKAKKPVSRPTRQPARTPHP